MRAMKCAAVVAMVLAADVSRADPPRPKPAKVGRATVSAVECTLDGPTPAVIKRFVGGLAVAGNHVYVMDGVGTVRRYRYQTTRGACTLVHDKTWGERALGHHDDTYYASLDVDAGGTVIASIPGDVPVRLTDTGTTEVCKAAGWMHAAPGASVLLRFESGKGLQVVDPASCNTRELDLDDREWPDGNVWLLDHRVGARARVKNEGVPMLYDLDGKQLFALRPPPEVSAYTPHSILRCGTGFCGIDNATLTVWNAKGAIVGTAAAGSLLGLEIAWLHAAARGKAGTFVLGHENYPDKDERVRIYRVDGLPRP
jgi:hypothetical protein